MTGKFRTDQKEPGNGQYLKYTSKDFLDKVAKPDIAMLHACRTQPMFQCMAQLVYNGWKQHNEHELAKTFGDNYLFHDSSNTWFYTALKDAGFKPHNQSIEVNNLEIKGSKDKPPLIRTGLAPTKMFNYEFPKLMYIHSNTRAGVQCTNRMLHHSTCIDGEIASDANQLKMGLDIVRYHDSSYLVNTSDFLLQPITQERVCGFEAVLRGEFIGSYQHRSLLHDMVRSLCHVTKCTSPDTGQQYFRGSCMQFQTKGRCPHAVRVMYSQQVLIMGHRIPTNKKKAYSKRRR